MAGTFRCPVTTTSKTRDAWSVAIAPILDAHRSSKKEIGVSFHNAEPTFHIQVPFTSFKKLSFAHARPLPSAADEGAFHLLPTGAGQPRLSHALNPITIAANDESYAYGFRRMLSETYIVDGLM